MLPWFRQARGCSCPHRLIHRFDSCCYAALIYSHFFHSVISKVKIVCGRNDLLRDFSESPVTSVSPVA
jgi:hypothetical protein